VDKYARKSGKKIETVPKDMIKTLQKYSWPGNVRELEHVIERAVIITEGQTLQIFDSFKPLKTPDAVESSPKDMAAMEREHILKILRETNWIIGGPRGAASILNINPSTLRFRIKKLGIQRP
jgi:transcriptional regulator with GAF, ATPase, and Fis domain